MISAINGQLKSGYLLAFLLSTIRGENFFKHSSMLASWSKTLRKFFFKTHISIGLGSSLKIASLLVSFSMSVSVLASPFVWQGPYGGTYMGGGWGNNDVSTNASNVTSTSYFTTSADINAVNNAGTWTNDPGALIGGIQFGHDWIWKQMVYGITFDYGALSLSSSRTINNTYFDQSAQYSVETSMRTNWLFTLRGRLGYQTNLYLPSLFYLTGGMAMTRLRVSNQFCDNSVFEGTSHNHLSQNQIGWTTGIGMEVAAFNHVTVDFEYLYVGVPSIDINGLISNTEDGFGIPVQSMNNLFSTTENFHANIFKIGLNYRFNEN